MIQRFVDIWMEHQGEARAGSPAACRTQNDYMSLALHIVQGLHPLGGDAA